LNAVLVTENAIGLSRAAVSESVMARIHRKYVAGRRMVL